MSNHTHAVTMKSTTAQRARAIARTLGNTQRSRLPTEPQDST